MSIETYSQNEIDFAGLILAHLYSKTDGISPAEKVQEDFRSMGEEVPNMNEVRDAFRKYARSLFAVNPSIEANPEAWLKDKSTEEIYDALSLTIDSERAKASRSEQTR